MTIMHSTQKMKNDKDHHHHYNNAQDNDDNDDDDKMSKIESSSHSNSGSGNRLSEFVTSTVESDKRSSYESDKELLGNNKHAQKITLQ